MNEPDNKTSKGTERERRVSHIVDVLGARDEFENVVRNVVGPKIKQRRISLGWTQERTAQEIKNASEGKWAINHLDVRRFEAQRKIITDRELQILAIALRCTAAWLLSEMNSPEPEFPLAEPNANNKSS